MIFEALNCLTEEINSFCRAKLRVNDNKVILSSLVNLDGSIAVQEENKVILTLVNLEREMAVAPVSGGAGRLLSSGNNALNINLHVLFSSYFSNSNYAEGLKFLSLVLSFFQQKPVFSVSNTPRLDPAIERLSLEVESPGLEHVNNLWATIGAKYLPSVLYKVRMLTYGGGLPEYLPTIRETDREAAPAAGSYS